MYIKKENIKNVWALLSSPVPDSDDIRKFETLGTRSFASEMAIGSAIDYHHGIGAERKFARLHFLQRYWTDKARTIPGVKVHTSPDPRFASALALVSVDGLTLAEMDNVLMGKHKIHTTSVDYERMFGIRITPNVYTSLKDLDRLINALHDMSAEAVKKNSSLGKK
jgi:selenocysteine lyase/cysteine desulfurase